MNAFLIPDNFVERTDLKLEENAAYAIPITEFRVWDALGTILPATAANDDLGLITGTWGNDYTPRIQGVDAGGTTETQYAGFSFALPPEYVAGTNFTVRINAGMLVVADASATVDVECIKTCIASPSDLCGTAAQSINSTTHADKDFTITGTTLSPGDRVSIRIKTVVTDAGNAAPNINSSIRSVKLLLSVRG